MAKISYCGGSSGLLGMLRTIVPVAQLSTVLSQEAKYLGKSFPKLEPTHPHAAVIEVVGDEPGQWQEGFYLAAKGPIEFEDHLRARLVHHCGVPSVDPDSFASTQALLRCPAHLPS